MDEMPPADVIELLDDIYDERGQEIWVAQWAASGPKDRASMERSIRCFADGSYQE